MNTRTGATAPHTEFFPPPPAPHAPARWVRAVAEDLGQLRRFWPVVQNMVVQELRVRYQRSVLGFFWTLLNPILMMATLTLVFSQFMGATWQSYVVFLFAGMVPWGLLSSSLNECAFCIIQNEGLIRKIYLPKQIFPLARVAINLTTFSLSMTALFLLLVPLGARFSPPMVLLPVVVLLFTAFIYGLCLIVATMNTFYRDCGHLVSVFLQAWYFATPIMYMASNLSATSQRRLWLNPAYPFIRLFQLVIAGNGQVPGGVWPDLTTFLAAAGLATVSLGVGYAAFKSYEDKLVFRL